MCERLCVPKLCVCDKAVYEREVSPCRRGLYTTSPPHTFSVMYESYGGPCLIEIIHVHISREKYEAHGGTMFPYVLILYIIQKCMKPRGVMPQPCIFL